MKTKLLLSTAIFALAPLSAATAQDEGGYFSVRGALTNLVDPTNSGAFTSDFTTGQGGSIDAGTVVGTGTSINWRSRVKTGYQFGAAAGWRFGNGFRTEAELSFDRAGVTSHDSIQLGGSGIGGQDVGLLITGSDATGTRIRELLADGQGNIKSMALMGNLVYDIYTDTAITPYIGGGFGYIRAKANYTPSGVEVASDSNGGLAYQFIAGVNYKVSDEMSVFADYRYRRTDDITVDLSLVPASIDIDNKMSTVSLGLSFNF